MIGSVWNQCWYMNLEVGDALIRSGEGPLQRIVKRCSSRDSIGLHCGRARGHPPYPVLLSQKNSQNNPSGTELL